MPMFANPNCGNGVVGGGKALAPAEKEQPVPPELPMPLAAHAGVLLFADVSEWPLLFANQSLPLLPKGVPHLW